MPPEKRGQPASPAVATEHRSGKGENRDAYSDLGTTEPESEAWLFDSQGQPFPVLPSPSKPVPHASSDSPRDRNVQSDVARTNVRTPSSSSQRKRSRRVLNIDDWDVPPPHNTPVSKRPKVSKLGFRKHLENLDHRMRIMEHRQFMILGELECMRSTLQVGFTKIINGFEEGGSQTESQILQELNEPYVSF